MHDASQSTSWSAVRVVRSVWAVHWTSGWMVSASIAALNAVYISAENRAASAAE